MQLTVDANEIMRLDLDHIIVTPKNLGSFGDGRARLPGTDVFTGREEGELHGSFCCVSSRRPGQHTVNCLEDGLSSLRLESKSTLESFVHGIEQTTYPELEFGVVTGRWRRQILSPFATAEELEDAVLEKTFRTFSQLYFEESQMLGSLLQCRTRLILFFHVEEEMTAG